MTQEQLQELSTKKTKLEFHMTQAKADMDSTEEKLNVMRPKILEQFGTDNVEELKKISDGLELAIKSDLEELASMGIAI